jgi:hypothetical protein
MGHEGIYSDASEYSIKEDCEVCSVRVKQAIVDKSWTLGKFIDNYLKVNFNLFNPSIYSGGNIVYVTGPEELRELYVQNLEVSLE